MARDRIICPSHINLTELLPTIIPLRKGQKRYVALAHANNTKLLSMKRSPKEQTFFALSPNQTEFLLAMIHFQRDRIFGPSQINRTELQLSMICCPKGKKQTLLSLSIDQTVVTINYQ